MEKTTLVLGASPKPERVSCQAIRSLRKRGIPVIAIGLREAKVGDVMIMKGIPPETGPVHTVTLYMNARHQVVYYDFILSLSPRRIIFNPGTSNPELAEMATIEGIEVVEGCMLMMLHGGDF